METPSYSEPANEKESIPIWSPFLFILCLFFVLTLCIICAHEIRKACSKAIDHRAEEPPTQQHVQVTLNLPNGEGTNLPDSPPPLYNNFQRQRSFVSYYSEDSSQVEIPPRYEDSLYIYTISSDSKPIGCQETTENDLSESTVNRLQRLSLSIMPQSCFKSTSSSLPSSPKRKHPRVSRSESSRY